MTHVSYAPRSVTVKSGESQVVVQLENSYINIGQVVVTGTGTHRRMKDSPVPVSVITAQDIREANLSTMEEVLTKMNASFAFVTSGMGDNHEFDGLNDDYILVLEKGAGWPGMTGFPVSMSLTSSGRDFERCCLGALWKRCDRRGDQYYYRRCEECDAGFQ